MIPGIAALLVCQFLGEVLVRLVGLPIPGPLVGMAILFGVLVVRGGVPESIEYASSGLLRYLSLYFVPAGVGVIAHGQALATALVPIVGAITVGTLLTVAATGMVMQRLSRAADPEGES